MKCLLTGGTGFLGSYLLEDICKFSEKVYLLARNESKIVVTDLPSNCEVVYGDIQTSQIIFDKIKRAEVLDEIDTLIHSAALYSLEATEADCYLSNVVGTQNICQFINQTKNLTFFHYISTYAVNPVSERAVPEEYLIEDTTTLINSYSKSKNLAEKFVRNFRFNEKVKVRIFRPGMILGDSQTGKIAKIDGPYYLYEIIKSHHALFQKLNNWPLPFPYSKSATVQVIPVDICSHIIVEIIKAPNLKKLRSYHLTSNEKIYVHELLKVIFRVFKLSPKLLPLPKIASKDYIGQKFNLPSSVLRYFYMKGSNSNYNLKMDYPNINLNFKSEILSALNKYKKDQ